MGNHSRPTPLTIIFWLICFSAMERSEVLNIVNLAIAKTNDSLVGSMMCILNESLSDVSSTTDSGTAVRPIPSLNRQLRSRISQVLAFHAISRAIGGYNVCC